MIEIQCDRVPKCLKALNICLIYTLHWEYLGAHFNEILVAVWAPVLLTPVLVQLSEPRTPTPVTPGPGRASELLDSSQSLVISYGEQASTSNSRNDAEFVR